MLSMLCNASTTWCEGGRGDATPARPRSPACSLGLVSCLASARLPVACIWPACCTLSGTQPCRRCPISPYPSAHPPTVHHARAQILNALSHAESSLQYMVALRDPAVFRFCAIPQVMALGTLARCYGNHAVFTGEGASFACLFV